MEWCKHLNELFHHEQRGMIFGGSLGLLLGVAILVFGFWNTFFVLCCGLLGLLVGKQADKGMEHLSSLQEMIWKRFQR